MASPREFTLTKHAIERLRQRNVEFATLVDSVCQPSETAKKKMMTYAYLYQATEESSFQNNLRFMTMLYEKYGFDNSYTMFVNGNDVFVGVSNERGNFIVTTLNRDEHTVPHVRNKIQKYSHLSEETV